MTKFKVRMAAPKTGELFLYDDIGESGWGTGIGAKQVADDLKGLGKIDTLMVRINSPGGSVFDGVAIYNVLARHPARIEVDIDGMALSIASVIAMAGDEIRIAKNAMMMIHDPWTIAMGSADDFRKQADLMDQVKGTLVSTYADRTRQPVEKIAALMSDETWFTAADAVEFGLADIVTEEQKMAAKFDPARFKNAPKDFAAGAEARPVANPFRAKLTDMQRRATHYGISP